MRHRALAQVGMWHLMPGNDLGENLGCMNLAFASDASLYEECRALLQTQMWDFVDAYYEANIQEADYGHNPEVLFCKRIGVSLAIGGVACNHIVDGEPEP